MKKRCGRCYFFKNKASYGSTACGSGIHYSCSELYTEANHLPCGDYRESKYTSESKLGPEIILNEARDKIEASENKNVFNISQKQNLLNILTDIFTIEQDVAMVIEKVQGEIEKQGFDIPFDSDSIERYTSKLSKLHLLYRMTMATGLDSYAEDIMKYEIEKLFADPRKYFNGRSPKRHFSIPVENS